MKLEDLLTFVEMAELPIFLKPNDGSGPKNPAVYLSLDNKMVSALVRECLAARAFRDCDFNWRDDEEFETARKATDEVLK